MQGRRPETIELAGPWKIDLEADCMMWVVALARIEPTQDG
jgi:hypothetical protein